MKNTSRQIWLAALLVALTGLVAGVLLIRSDPEQIITLSGGQRYRFAGVTFGTNHVQPTLAVRTLHHLPVSLTAYIRKKLGNHLGPDNSFSTTEPLLVVWLQRLSTNAISWSSGALSDAVHASLADRNGVRGGLDSSDDPWGCDWRDDHTMYDILRGTHSLDWPIAAFGQVAPKRSHTLECVVSEDIIGTTTNRQAGRVRFSNPFYGRFPQWQPEPIPAVKKAGDLEVHLENLVVGAYQRQPVVLPDGSRGLDYRTPRPGEKVWTVFDLLIRSPAGSNDVWTVESADLSDATGSHLHAIPHFNAQLWGSYRYSIAGSLWPDETAWRLKIELKRKSGFSPAELITFNNVPLLNKGATNSVCLTNAIGSAQAVLTESWDQYEPGFRIQLIGGPESTLLSFVGATNANNQNVGAFEVTTARLTNTGHFDTSNAYRVVRPPFILPGVYLDTGRTVKLTWAMQQTRTVEFLVKPPRTE